MECLLPQAKRLLKVGLFLFILLMAALLTLGSFQHYAPYSNPSGFLLDKQAHYSLYLPALYGHITSSGLILLVGFLGFIKTIRERWLVWHQRLGKIYVFLIIFISAPSGLVMAFYATTGGLPVNICFLLLSSLWWYVTWKAWRHILQQNIHAHRAFMLRSYALTLSAITLRWYTFLGAYFWQLQGADVYVWLAWLSWLPNLLLVELYLRFSNED